MSLFAFIELPPPLDSWVIAPDVLFPVRTEVAADFQQSDSPDATLLLLELERYLEENPDKAAVMRRPAGNWRSVPRLNSSAMASGKSRYLSTHFRCGCVPTT